MFSRRQLLQSSSCGFGILALAGLLDSLGLRGSANAASESANPLLPKKPHFAAKAKRVIFMFMQGAPSHVDTFDYKPQLEKDDGKTAGGGKGNRKLLKSPFAFKKSGSSGLALSLAALAAEFFNPRESSRPARASIPKPQEEDWRSWRREKDSIMTKS